VNFSAKRIKQSVTGNGNASKTQVQRAVQHRFSLGQPPHPPDVADALAVALCHAHHSLTLEKLSRSASRVPARPARSLATPA